MFTNTIFFFFFFASVRCCCFFGLVWFCLFVYLFWFLFCLYLCFVCLFFDIIHELPFIQEWFEIVAKVLFLLRYIFSLSGISKTEQNGAWRSLQPYSAAVRTHHACGTWPAGNLDWSAAGRQHLAPVLTPTRREKSTSSVKGFLQLPLPTTTTTTTHTPPSPPSSRLPPPSNLSSSLPSPPLPSLKKKKIRSYLLVCRVHVLQDGCTQSPTVIKAFNFFKTSWWIHKSLVIFNWLETDHVIQQNPWRKRPSVFVCLFSVADLTNSLSNVTTKYPDFSDFYTFLSESMCI